MAKEDWQLSPIKNRRQKQEEAYAKFALKSWTNDPNAYDVNDAYLAAAFTERDKNTTENLLRDNFFQGGSVLAAMLGGPLSWGFNGLAATEAMFNARRDKYRDIYNQLTETLGRKPTQEEFNEAYAQRSVIPEIASGVVDFAAGSLPLMINKKIPLVDVPGPPQARRLLSPPKRKTVTLSIPARAVLAPSWEGLGNIAQAYAAGVN